MEILLHAGLDKCGSTAIQAHLKDCREWFLARGVYVPATGLTRVGHFPLFKDSASPDWQKLGKELEEAGEYNYAILSYEGLHFLEDEQLALIREHLQGHALTFLFYLREQSEIIQSGYLQKLKRRKQPYTLADYRQITPLHTA